MRALRFPATAVLVATFTAGLVLLTAAAASAQAPATRSAEELYDAGCAHCHGRDGRGVSADRLALPVPLPDFTDCQFAPREPDSDWAAVIHEGGPARAFHRTMPAFDGALTSDEIGLALSHVRTFCGERAWPRGELNFPKALVTEKAFPEDEVIFTSSFATEGDGAVASKYIYEKRFGAQNQIEVVVPLTAYATAGDWTAGVGDLAFAFKRVLAHSHRRGSIVSLTGELVFPTGAEDKKLGKGYGVIEPFVTFGQALPGDGFFQFQGGGAFPTDGDAHKSSFFRFVTGKTWTRGRWGRAWSPMVEFLGSKTHAEGKKVQWDILPQLQVSLSTRQHILMNMGLRMPLTDSGTRKTQFVVYLLWDTFDGGFFQGW
jgi:mono/diheme cytochrome c family protein